ncbi:MAG: immunoglobulin domain-containing protein [Verrucomicrobia bacterium]|nr:immunoglobulin domain-containing protein [Verrucomicrobiota bacterium]
MKRTLIPSILATLAFVGAATADINSGLQLYLPFSGSFADASSVARTVTPNGGAALGADRTGASQRACVMDGVSDSVDVSPCVAGTTDFTLAMWVYLAQPQSVGGYYSLIQSANAQVTWAHSMASSGNPVYDLNIAVFPNRDGRYSVNWYTVNGAGLLNRWAHVTVAVSGATTRIYIDGQEQPYNGPRYDGGMGAYLEQVRLGAVCNGRDGGSYSFLNGSIDEVRVYDRTLTTAEVQEVMAPNQAPTMSVQPTAIAAATGTTATFTVVAAGAAPMSYLWRKDGVNLSDGGSVSGATATTLTLANVQESDEGSYDVVVANNLGTATSSAAALTVSAVDPLNLGLMAYYPLNGNGLDASGQGNHAIAVGSPSWGADHLGNPASACQLNGSSDYFNLTAARLSFSGDFSVAAWVQIPTPNLFNPIFGNWTRDIPGFAFTTYSGVLHFNGSSFATSVTGTRNVCNGGWHHVVAVRQAGQGRLYVDGVLDASANVGTGDVTHTQLERFLPPKCSSAY